LLIHISIFLQIEYVCINWFEKDGLRMLSNSFYFFYIHPQMATFLAVTILIFDCVLKSSGVVRSCLLSTMSWL